MLKVEWGTKAGHVEQSLSELRYNIEKSIGGTRAITMPLYYNYAN